MVRFILIRLWRLFAPVLLQQERKLVVAFSFFAVLLFVVGAYFGYRIVFPLTALGRYVSGK